MSKDDMNTQEFMIALNRNQHHETWAAFYAAMKEEYIAAGVPAKKIPSEHRVNMRCHRVNDAVEEATGHRFSRPAKPPQKQPQTIAEILAAGSFNPKEMGTDLATKSFADLNNILTPENSGGIGPANPTK